MKQDVCNCTLTVSQRDRPVRFLCPPDTLQGAVTGRAGVGLGTHWSPVGFGTFLCGPGAKEKRSIALCKDSLAVTEVL